MSSSVIRGWQAVMEFLATSLSGSLPLCAKNNECRLGVRRMPEAPNDAEIADAAYEHAHVNCAHEKQICNAPLHRPHSAWKNTALLVRRNYRNTGLALLGEPPRVHVFHGVVVHVRPHIDEEGTVRLVAGDEVADVHTDHTDHTLAVL